MKASEMTPGTVYSHAKHGLLTLVSWYTEREEIILRDMLDGAEGNGRSGRLLVLILSKSRSNTGELLRLSGDEEVHKAFGVY